MSDHEHIRRQVELEKVNAPNGQAKTLSETGYSWDQQNAYQAEWNKA